MYFTHPQLKNLKPLFKKTSEAKLKQRLAKFFPDRHIIFTDLGRSAFQLAVKELGLENSEMLVPAYICDIFKPIFKHYNIKPIYLDIDLETFNINPDEIEKRITSNSKSILICHTYGNPLEMDKILEIAKKHNLKIIEDCAHLFPDPPRASETGRRGDCAFFSFSKTCPTINGGVFVSKKPIKTNLKDYEFKLSNLIKFTRLFPFLAMLSEKFRTQGKTLAINKRTPPRKASRMSLKIFGWYLDNFEQQISKRSGLAEYFQDKLREIGFQTSPGISYISALVPKNISRDELFTKLRKHYIFCSRIWRKPIILDKEQYPNSYEAAQRIINFPFQNWYSKKDIDKMVKRIKFCLRPRTGFEPEAGMVSDGMSEEPKAQP